MPRVAFAKSSWSEHLAEQPTVIRNNLGFTLVELVSVILLIGVLSTVAIGRLTKDQAFDKKLALDAIVSLVRQTQQRALGGSGVALRVESSGTNIVISRLAGGVTEATRTFSSDEVAITAGSIGSGTSCSDISSTMTLNFDSAADIETVDEDGFPICLDANQSLCISPGGFAHIGACL